MPKPPTAATQEAAVKAVRSIFDRYTSIAKSQNYTGFDFHLMNSLRLVSAHPAGRATFALSVGPEFANMNGVLHGGATALIFDMCTTMALGPLAKKGEWEFLGGVTRSLNISYLRAVPIGTRVRIRSEVVQRGKTMALIRGVMVHDDDDGVSSSRDHHGGGEDVDDDNDGRGEGLASRVYATVDHHKVHVPSKALAEFETAEATAVEMGARGLGGNGKTAEKL